MRFTIVIVLLLILSGCERGWDGLIAGVLGTETNTVVLSSSKFVVGPAGRTFYVNGDAKAVGRSAYVCVSLRGNFSTHDQKLLDAEYEQLMKGATLKATIEMSDGRSIRMSRSGRHLSRYGKVFDKNELAACVHIDCAEAGIERDATIQAISIFSSEELEVGGAYWGSTDAWDNGG